MAEAREGQSFIKHELDEAIAIQQAIVETERQLADGYPLPDAEKELKGMVSKDETQLQRLQELGRAFGATGDEREDVARGMEDLARQVTRNAQGGPDSEKYEMQAVLLTMKRKQQDSAKAMIEIARATNNADMRRAATEMFDETRAGADALSTSLAKLATELASRGQQADA